jgi:hypothetical protein
MGKVYVLRKDADANQSSAFMMGGGQSGGGLGNVMYNLPNWVTPEEAVYGTYDKQGNVTSPGALPTDGTATREQGKHAEKWARGLGRAGLYAGAGLGGLSAFYNLSSSGQPLDFSGMANIGTAAYTGGRTAQPYSTTLGARIGVRRGRGTGTPENNTTVPTIASPKQLPPPRTIDAEFTEEEAMSPTNSAMDSLREESRKQNWFNNNDNYHPMNALRQEYP